MKNTKLEILEKYREILIGNRAPLNPTELFPLLFDSNETIQIKCENWIRATNAHYVGPEDAEVILQSASAKASKSGWQFCMNAVPLSFLASLHEIYRIEMMGDPQWDRVLPELQENLSLAGSLFEGARNFFVEADQLPTGRDIESTEDKLSFVETLLDLNLPISYIIDTGGRGAHLGLSLDVLLNSDDFNELVRNVMIRLPSWIDSGVGRLNQLERLPGTTRINKQDSIVQVTLAYVGDRVATTELKQWIQDHEIINPGVAIKRRVFETRQIEVSDSVEQAAWDFIAKHGLDSSDQVRSKKIQVTCPEASNHKRGIDRNKSAFISLESGRVWCATCHKNVGSIFVSKKLIGTDSEEPNDREPLVLKKLI